MYEEGADYIIGGADGAFGFAVLLGSVRIGQTKNNAVFGTKGIYFGVIKFATIVTLNSKNR